MIQNVPLGVEQDPSAPFNQRNDICPECGSDEYDEFDYDEIRVNGRMIIIITYKCLKCGEKFEL